MGRTGSGKSTLFLSILRIIEPVEGAILIDNVDISQLEGQGERRLCEEGLSCGDAGGCVEL